MPKETAKEKKMRFSKIGQTILLALSLTAIIVATSCSGADATKPEDMKVDLSKELGYGRMVTTNLTTTDNNGVKSVTVDTNFLSELLSHPSMTSYSSGNGAGITVTDILKALNGDSQADITASVNAVKNDAGGVYRVDISDTTVTNVKIEYRYKLKAITTSTTSPKTTHTKIGVNNDTTNWTSLDLTNVTGLGEGSLLGKTYVFGASANIKTEPTQFSNGMITTNILTVSVSSNGGMYKLWIY